MAGSPAPSHISRPASADSPLGSKRRRLASESGRGTSSGSGSGSGSGTGSGYGAAARCVSESSDTARGAGRTAATPPQPRPTLSQADLAEYRRNFRPAEKQLKTEQNESDAYPTEHGEWTAEIAAAVEGSQQLPKQEPIDLTEDDDVDSALGCVAAIEAGYGPPPPPPPPPARAGLAPGAPVLRFGSPGESASRMRTGLVRG